MIQLGLVLLVLAVTTSADAQLKSYIVTDDRNRVMFEATYPLGDFTGATEKVAGEFRINPGNVTRGVTGSVIVHPADLRTGIEGRDRDLRKALETEKYPEIRFTVEEVHASFPSLTDRADIAVTIKGVMVIRRVERPMTWTGRARIDEGQLWVRGEAELKMTDFGITPPRKFFLTVDDGVRLGFDLRLTPRE